MNKEQLNQQYKELAAQLGDIQFKRKLLTSQEEVLLKQIELLNMAMEKLNRETENKKV